MKSYKLLREVIEYLERYEKRTPETSLSLDGFLKFLNKKRVGTPESKDVRFGDQAVDAQQLAAEVENTISRLFTYMSRYSRYYVKKALDGTPLQIPEEFTYLALLLTHDSMTKTELINKNLQEKTTGTEIIKRLIASGLVMQAGDPVDKRSKRVSITPAGKGVLYSIFRDMGNVSKMITGNLTIAEKKELLSLLLKLEAFHHPVFESKLISDKEALNKMVETLKSADQKLT